MGHLPKALGLLSLLGALTAGCASPPRPAALSSEGALTLAGSDGRPHTIADELRQATLTVFVFYSETCPCMQAHEPRLKQLFSSFSRRGVAFRLVNSEVGASASRDARVAAERGYPFLLLTDPGAQLAHAVGAEYATHSVVLDPSGKVKYSGGIDSDKNRLHADATPYLSRALEALLGGRAAPTPREALGCSLWFP